MEYPRPDIPETKVPKMDTVFQSALGRSSTDRSDEQLAKIQTTVLAACSPLANLCSHMEIQGIMGKPGEVVTAEDVIKVAKDSLALLGNANCYISEVRRSQFINSIVGQRPTVAKFLRDVAKEGKCGSSSELFGPEIHKRITDRADTIEAFNKAVSKVEPARKQTSSTKGEGRFLFRRPAAYGSRSGREYVPYRPLSNRGRQSRPPFRGGQGKYFPKHQFGGPSATSKKPAQ